MIWHQQVKQFKRRSLCAQWSFVEALLSFSSFLLSIRRAHVHGFFPSLRCSLSKLLRVSSTARPPSPPPLPHHHDVEGRREREHEGEEKKSYAETEEWSYLHPEIPLLLDCAESCSLRKSHIVGGSKIPKLARVATCVYEQQHMIKKHPNTMSNCVKLSFLFAYTRQRHRNSFEVVQFDQKLDKSEQT